MFFSRQHKMSRTHARVDGVRSLTGPRAVLTHSRKVVEFHSDAAFDFMWRHRAPIGVITLGAVVMTAVLIGSPTQASVSLFYPTSCLGGWQSPMHASGMPTDKPAMDRYTTGNSAILENADGDLFCGSFSGEKVNNTDPTSLALVLDVAFGDQPESVGDSAVIPQPASENSETTNSVTPESNLATPETSVESAPAPSAGTSVETPVDVDPSTPVVPDVPAAPETPAAPASTDQSLKDRFLSLFTETAHAQDATTDTTSDVQTSTPQESTTQPVTVSTPIQEGFLNVFYSLDGKDWKLLGTVGDISNHAPSFIFPQEVVSDWSVLDKLQIKISPVLSINMPSKIYVRSIRAEVSYKTREEATVADISKRSDQKNYSITAIDMKTEQVLLSVIKDPDQGDILNVRTSNQGALYIFDGQGQLVSNSGIGEDPIPFPAYNFSPGDFTIVYTTSQTACDGLILDACMKVPSFVEAAHFSVAATDNTPLGDRSAQPASPDNLILPPINTPPVDGGVVHAFTSLVPSPASEQSSVDSASSDTSKPEAPAPTASTDQPALTPPDAPFVDVTPQEPSLPDNPQ